MVTGVDGGGKFRINRRRIEFGWDDRWSAGVVGYSDTPVGEEKDQIC